MKTILVADAEPGFRDLCAFALEPMGYRVVTVGDGASALAQVATRAFDLVLLDHHMPRVGGLEALAQIHALLPHLPILLISASVENNEGLSRDVLRAGASACLFKPLDLGHLVSAIEATFVAH